MGGRGVWVREEDLKPIPMGVEKFHVENYKNLEGEFRFSPITVIVGPNGSGKTALFEAMSLLSELAKGPQGDKPIEQIFLNMTGYPGFWGAIKDAELANPINLGIYWDDETSYQLDIVWKPNLGIVIPVNEIFNYKGEANFKTGKLAMSMGIFGYEVVFLKKQGLIRFTTPIPLSLKQDVYPQDPGLQDLRSRLVSFRFYKFKIRDIGKNFADLGLTISDKELFPDGSNVAQVLFRLKQEEDEAWEIIAARIQEITGAKLVVKLDKEKSIFWVELKFGKFSIPLGGAWPDGWKSYLLLLVALHTARSLVFVEEPENFMHPGLLEMLVDDARMLIEEKGLQFIFTTHSTSFVNFFNYKEVRLMESGKMFELKAGRWMKKVGLSLGDALASGLIEEAIKK